MELECRLHGRGLFWFLFFFFSSFLLFFFSCFLRFFCTLHLKFDRAHHIRCDDFILFRFLVLTTGTWLPYTGLLWLQQPLDTVILRHKQTVKEWLQLLEWWLVLLHTHMLWVTFVVSLQRWTWQQQSSTLLWMTWICAFFPLYFPSTLLPNTHQKPPLTRFFVIFFFFGLLSYTRTWQVHGREQRPNRASNSSSRVLYVRKSNGQAAVLLQAVRQDVTVSQSTCFFSL